MLNDLITRINSKIPNAKASLQNPLEDGAGDSSVLIESDSIFDTCKYLKDEENFRVLEVISGVDYTEYIEVCYMLASFDLKASTQVILKVRLTDRENPRLKTVTDLWMAADWQERECYDMLGVSFDGHPDHRRILCPDDWEGFPLRKDYKVQEIYRGMAVNPESKMNLGVREFEQRHKDMEDELMKRSLERGL